MSMHIPHVYTTMSMDNPHAYTTMSMDIPHVTTGVCIAIVNCYKWYAYQLCVIAR